MHVEKFSQIEVAPGERAFAFLDVAVMADGAPLGIPVHVLRGKKDGPKIVVMATAHGYEICQISVIKELLETLDANEVRGTVVFVPVQNPVAFEMGTRGTWVDALWGDSGNMNRLWPGRPNGWLTERMTHKLSSEVFPGSDLVIDMHASGPGLTLAYGYYGSISEEEIEISKVFGHDILVNPLPAEIDEKMQWTTSRAYLKKAGIPSYGCEIGEFPGLWSERHRPRARRTVPDGRYAPRAWRRTPAARAR